MRRLRVHVVDKNTGCYIEKKHEQEDTMVYHKEDITFFDSIERRYETSQNNIILPFATNMCDFRELGNSIGTWNESNPAPTQSSTSTTPPASCLHPTPSFCSKYWTSTTRPSSTRTPTSMTKITSTESPGPSSARSA